MVGLQCTKGDGVLRRVLHQIDLQQLLAYGSVPAHIGCITAYHQALNKKTVSSNLGGRENKELPQNIGVTSFASDVLFFQFRSTEKLNSQKYFSAVIVIVCDGACDLINLKIFFQHEKLRSLARSEPRFSTYFEAVQDKVKSVPITPPSVRVSTIVAERGRSLLAVVGVAGLPEPELL